MRRTSEVSQKSDFNANVVPCNRVEEKREKIKNWQSLYLQALWPDEVRIKIFRQSQDVQKKMDSAKDVFSEDSGGCLWVSYVAACCCNEGQKAEDLQESDSLTAGKKEEWVDEWTKK